jgi:hypothetical protein
MSTSKRSWLLPVSIAAAVVLLCSNVPFQNVWDDGIRDMNFQFVVLDAATQQPLPEAKLRLLDDVTSKWETIQTAADGTANITLPCMTSLNIKSGLLWRYTQRSIYYPHRTLLVSKLGFTVKGPVALTELVGRGYVGEYRPPPVVRIELQPK